MPKTRRHICLNVRGFLRNSKFPKDYRDMFEDDNGNPLSAYRARDFLLVHVAKGHVVIPCSHTCGNPCKQPGCTGFDHAGGGCPGYPIDDTEPQPDTTAA